MSNLRCADVNPFLAGRIYTNDFPQRLLGGYTIMPKDLNILVAEAVNEFNQLVKIEELLAICFEELEERSEKSQIRAEFLLELCLPYANLHFGELRLALDRIQKFLDLRTSCKRFQ